LSNDGVNFPVQNLYPVVEFPVSRGTPQISSLVRWDHEEDWFVMKYENIQTKSRGEREVSVNLRNENEEFMAGHVIDGKILVPATCYLQYVWETFSSMYHGMNFMDVPVEFEDIKFLRATNVTAKNTIDLTVMIHYGTGIFEITESGALVVTGKISEIENPTIPNVQYVKENSDFPMVSKKDFYKELKLRGYHYNGAFQSVQQARGDGLYGKVEWEYNWVTFIDAMLQIHILGVDSRGLLLPTKIRKLRINGKHHFDLIANMDPEKQILDVYVDPELERIVSGGIELIGLHASSVQRRKPPGVPVLEKYSFLPHFPTPLLSVADAARTCVQLALENTILSKLKIVEVDSGGRAPIIASFLDSIEDLPLITGDYLFLSNQTLADFPANIHVENGKLSKQSNCHFIIIGGQEGELNKETIQVANKSLANNGYLVIREQTSSNIEKLEFPEHLEMLAVMPLDSNEEVLLLLQKPKKDLSFEIQIVQVSDKDENFEWLSQVQQAISNKTAVVVYAFNEKLNGLIGLVNCLRKEPDGNLITCFFINDPKAPPFNLNDPFYANQFRLNMPINVYKNGNWGTYRHLQLNTEEVPIARADHVYGNVLQRGDLSSFRWFEGPLDPKKYEIKVVYSSVNFRDVMLATGRLGVEIFAQNRMDQNCVLGLEYSGIDTKTGRRIMSMVPKGGIASYVEKQSRLIWEVPDHWSLKEAATVPVVYITVYYAFFMCSDIRKGQTILIHAGTGGVGLAAIRTALAYNMEVFTTCSTSQKKQFLLETFPQLKESHIGNSRDISFEDMIRRETKGKGVDFVLNSLSDEKLLASVRCLGMSGHFLEIGKFDMANDSKLGMSCFLKEITFHAVLADRLANATDKEIAHLTHIINVDLAKGIIQPLPATVFQASEIEQAFRYLAGGKHIGKVLVQIREDPQSKYTMPLVALNQVYFNPNLSYIIPGGLGGFGLELADWMVIRGARNIVLSSRRGIINDYQSYRIALWKTYGCSVYISTSDITTYDGCSKLLNEATSMAPVGGIFNLAVALHDGVFTNLSKEKFKECLAPKAFATTFLDELSRKKCPNLEHFIVFSSVSCGRGNAGQTNYGMANSIMERIIEDRIANGYPAKAIQWGAVGEVGLVADLAEDKIDMEIGGTLQQRISSCLQELDTLISSPDAIVSSMVVAEKRAGVSGNDNIVETVMNIMGIRDLKSVSLGTPLSEMGMDSLMTVEIKQALERDFEVLISPQDLRSLTFQKLQEFADKREHQTKDIKMLFSSEKEGVDILLRNLGNESGCNDVIVQLNTATNSSAKSIPIIIIPGLEGTPGEIWFKIAAEISSQAILLQLHSSSGLNTVKEVAEISFEHVKSVLSVTEPFYIVGYSFGSCVAIELVGLLEKAGFKGQLLLLDGAPHFLTKFMLLQLNDNFVDLDIYNLLLSAIPLSFDLFSV
ncbi:hypothetical protein DOY81_010253, partial [Sarcophaga bullata]